LTDFLVKADHDQRRAIASVFLYGPNAADTAATEQTKWAAWLRGLLEGERVAP
jgi:hypothetical protein